MTRHRAVALALALAAGLTAESAAAAPAPQRPPVSATTWIASGPYLFGDSVHARLEVFVDPSRVDPASVRVESRFDPYAPVDRVARSRTSADGSVRLVWNYTLECLWVECLGSQAKARRISPKQAAIRFETRSGRRRTVRERWPSFRLVYRTELPAEQQLPATRNVPSLLSPLRTDTVPPEADPRLAPRLVGAAVLGAAAFLLAAAALVLWPVGRFVRERLGARGARRPLTPLEEALEQVEAAAGNGAGGALHREALALLARELRRAGLPDLVTPARRLAWSSEPPTRAASLELARRVRQAVARQPVLGP